MNLGQFSISLAVEDIAVSLEFYRKLGFEQLDGNMAEKWLILQNGATKIGLFEGMLQDNLLTFQPDDVRAVQKSLKSQGVTFEHEADESSDHEAHAQAPVFASLRDPDGNAILLDQKFAK